VVSNNYRQARAAIHGVDSTHLIGARSGYGGNGERAICGDAPVDLRAGAKHLDFVSPEGYALPSMDRVGLLNRGGFTVAYGDVGKPVYWAEYGINVDGSCPTCTDNVQTQFTADMYEMMRQTASNGGADWWFVGVRPQGAGDTEKSDFGIIHDYVDLPTSVDSSGIPMRDGALALCADSHASLGLFEAPDKASAAGGTCPAGMRARGAFRPDWRALKPSAGGKPQNHKDWMALCGADESALLAVSYDDQAKQHFDCQAGYSAAGSFKPGNGANNGPTGIDAAGRSITSGWLTLCTERGVGLLKRVSSNMSGREFSCPTGFKEAGKFGPEVAAIFRPAAKLLAGALSGVSGDQRVYSKWITVDRDAAAGDWKMYSDGTNAYAAAATPGQRVGVHTACFATTSREVKQCVGNAPYNGACPAKCLNAELETVEILNSAGQWQMVSAGESIAVASGKPVRARLVAGNTGESTWLTRASAGGSRGSVSFGCNETVGDVRCRNPIAKDREMFADSASGEFSISDGVRNETRVVFQMLSNDVAWFGERVRVTLVAR